jgi:hypothetical protein
VASQATVEPEDIEDLVDLLKEKDSPQGFNVLLERYVARLKERAIKEAETVAANP